jgi:hypothetical protein
MAVEIKLVEEGRAKFDKATNVKLVIDNAELPIQYTRWSQFREGSDKGIKQGLYNGQQNNKNKKR